MAELHYKASSIARAERELGPNFFTTLEGVGEGTPSFNAILMILMAGGLTDQEADDLLDNEGIEAAMKLAIDALGSAGFLAKVNLTTSALTNQQQKTSQNTGVTTKA